MLEEIALDLAEMYGDRLRLRIVPSRGSMHSAIGMPLRAHRDTWGSGIMAQINWWLPLYSLEPSRTMLVWPGKFKAPVANTSREWDYGKLVAQRAGGTCNYPLLPVARTSPSPRNAIAVLIQPGELLAFSGAHLHGSVRDDTGLSRISLDTRTVWHKDIACGRGARNVDGATRRPHWEWFARFSDGASLAVPRDGRSSPNATTADEKPRQTHGGTH